jgi:pimeloyl-ACP methyl ester carboxylesterase
MRTGVLNVPGAALYHEIRGSGPTLLMIPGGPMDAAGFAPLAERLADRYTVITYDCRGNSRSPHDGTTDDLTVEVLADDAHRLLEAVGSEPTYVLGSSGGATYGLDLVARYPGGVRTLVAHEPPVSSLLPDAERWWAFNEEIAQISRTEGTFAALQRFGEGLGLAGEPPPAEMSPEAQEASDRMSGNFELFAARLIPVVGNYLPDIAALRASGTRIVLGIGEGSATDQLPARSARALAEELGVEPVLFPGDHGGFGSHPDAFAATLEAVFSETE